MSLGILDGVQEEATSQRRQRRKISQRPSPATPCPLQSRARRLPPPWSASVPHISLDKALNNAIQYKSGPSQEQNCKQMGVCAWEKKVLDFSPYRSGWWWQTHGTTPFNARMKLREDACLLMWKVSKHYGRDADYSGLRSGGDSH